MYTKIKKTGRRIAVLFLGALIFWQHPVKASAEMSVAAPSAILIESSTGKVIYERNASERRSPASITKIMTLLITFEKLSDGSISLGDELVTSAYASSMGGSQVYLDTGEVQTLETLIKCIAVSSANDASVVVAEYIAGSEDAFVELMNEKAAQLGMKDTHFVDCCGLTDSDDHYTTARDVAIMARELTVKYPQIFDYSQIWMEDITHVTARGISQFGLTNTNKFLRQYQWATGLKTGYTRKAMYCLCATAAREDIALIAVVMGEPDPEARKQDAITLMSYGFSVTKLYVDEEQEALPRLAVEGGVADHVELEYGGVFRYVDIEGYDLSRVEKVICLPRAAAAPVAKGDAAGEVLYLVNGTPIGRMPILYGETVEKAVYRDYLARVFDFFLL